MNLLLDTNVVSEMRKIRARKADSAVAAWAGRVDPGSLYISVITIQELEIGVRRAERRDPGYGVVLRGWMQTVSQTFAGRILDVDIDVAMRSAMLQVPDPRPILDALIAATALVHRMTMVTRNTADFAATGVPLLNPWAPAPA